MRRVSIGQGAAIAENNFCQKPEMFPFGVKVHFARGREEWMPVQDDDAFAILLGMLSKSLGQLQLFGGKQLVTEPADFPEHRRVTKNERAGEQLAQPAGAVPGPGDGARR